MTCCGSSFEFLSSFHTTCGGFGKADVNSVFRFRVDVFESEIPLSRPKFDVETGGHGRESNCVCIFDVLFEEKTLVFGNEIFATVSVAMDTCCQMKGFEVGSVQMVTSQGSAHFQKMVGSKREEMD